MTRCRNKLKTRICDEFSESLTFLTPANNQAEVVISTSVLSKQCHFSDDSILRNAAYHFRHEIFNFENQKPQPKWPPTPDELTSDERNPPKLVTDFLTYGVTKGKVIPGKHFLLALDLHNIIGKKCRLKLIISRVIV